MKDYEDENWKFGRFNMHCLGDQIISEEALRWDDFAIHVIIRCSSASPNIFVLSSAACGLRLGLFDNPLSAKLAANDFKAVWNDWSFEGLKNLTCEKIKISLRSILSQHSNINVPSPHFKIKPAGIKNMETETCTA